jgi:hypothetical protein
MRLALVAWVVLAAALAAGVAHAQPVNVAKVLYINRCVGGCQIKKGGYPGNAIERTSSIPRGPDGTIFTISEFRWGDEVWDAVMQCLREVYSPYSLTVTDQKPAPGVAFNEGIVAGSDHEINYSAGGVAPVTSDCSPFSYVISFTFANQFGANPLSICAVAAQETGHAFGLEHVFEYDDGRSACNDPMSYRNDCGGQKFFRNESARCGEYSVQACGCGGFQNNHFRLLGMLGAATPTTAPPVVSITSPGGGAIAQGADVIAIASAQRGIKRVELILNGYKWAEVPGAPFGRNGQAESAYVIALPPNVPDGIIDIVARAKDDIDIATDSAPITVTKGEPCTSADTCATGQRCEDGRCFWDPPVGDLGEECGFTQFCKSELCASVDSGESRCSQPCVVGTADSCPAGYECLASSASTGVCWPEGDAAGGCCSASSGALAQSGLFAVLLGLVLGRRRRAA